MDSSSSGQTAEPVQQLATVAIFAYRRPAKLSALLDSLAKCPEAPHSDLLIYVDGPKNNAEASQVQEVLTIARSEVRFASSTVVSHAANMGLSASLIHGVTEVLQTREEIIVLEDDLVVSPHFLRFMNDALDVYRESGEVASIHGYSYPTKTSLPSTFFLRGADCWGWATWSRAWKIFNPDSRDLLRKLAASGEKSAFDFNGHYRFSRLLEGQLTGENDSWAVRWYASAFLERKLTLYPGEPLVANTGLDGSGTHGKGESRYWVEPTSRPVPVTWHNPVESTAGRRAFEEFFRKTKPPLLRRAAAKLFRIRKTRRFGGVE